MKEHMNHAARISKARSFAEKVQIFADVELDITCLDKPFIPETRQSCSEILAQIDPNIAKLGLETTSDADREMLLDLVPKQFAVMKGFFTHYGHIMKPSWERFDKLQKSDVVEQHLVLESVG